MPQHRGRSFPSSALTLSRAPTSTAHRTRRAGRPRARPSRSRPRWCPARRKSGRSRFEKCDELRWYHPVPPTDHWRLARQHARGHEIADPGSELRVGHRHCLAAVSIRAMMIASMLRSDLMALRLSLSASSRRSSSVRRSLTWPGIADGFARREMAIWLLPQVRGHGDVALEPQADFRASWYRSRRVSYACPRLPWEPFHRQAETWPYALGKTLGA